MKFMRQLSEPAPLFEMPEGRPLRITDVQGSPDLRSKLYAMGLLPGTPIKICNRSCGQGSLCVRVRHCSLVIGEVLARAIVCRPDSAHGRGHGHGIGHGHGHGHGHRHGIGHSSEILSPECGPCPHPEGVDIMDLRECACPDDMQDDREPGAGSPGGGEPEAGGQGGRGHGGKGQGGRGHGGGSHGGRGHGAGGCGGGEPEAGGQGGRGHGGRWKFFGS